MKIKIFIATLLLSFVVKSQDKSEPKIRYSVFTNYSSLFLEPQIMFLDETAGGFGFYLERKKGSIATIFGINVVEDFKKENSTNGFRISGEVKKFIRKKLYASISSYFLTTNITNYKSSISGNNIIPMLNRIIIGFSPKIGYEIKIKNFFIDLSGGYGFRIEKTKSIENNWTYNEYRTFYWIRETTALYGANPFANACYFSFDGIILIGILI